MSNAQQLIELEKTFWQSMIDEQTHVALALLKEPSIMVSPHGAMKFDHATYRHMAEQGTMVVKAFELSDIEAIFPNETTGILMYRVQQTVAMREGGQTLQQTMLDTSTWVREGAGWKCVMHTETPADTKENK